MLCYVSELHSFSWLNNIPLYVCTTFGLSSHLWMDSWIASTNLAVMNSAAVMLRCKYLFESLLSILLG